MHHDRRKVALTAAFLLGALTLGACERELPTEVGGEELPESALRTYEIILQDEDFLLGDTLVRGFGTGGTSSILLVADEWRDTLNAHALVRFADFPETLTYADSASGTRTDTIARFIEAKVVVRVDTVSLRLDTIGTDTTIGFEMYEVAEAFDPRTATWDARIATPGDTTPWMTPGGTTGALIGTATWTRSDTVAADSMVFTIDSATISEWASGSVDDRAILLATTTDGARAQLFMQRLRLTVRLKGEEDTTRTVTVGLDGQTYVYDPPPPVPTEELRIGDRSAWRSFLTFAPRLDSLTIPCPDDPVNCSFQLSEVTVNRADLRLTPLSVPLVYRPRNNVSIEARPVLGDGTLALERAALGDTVGIARSITPTAFEVDADSIVRIGVTRFVRDLFALDPDSTLTDRDRTLALLTAPEPLSFGIVRFGSSGSEYAPVLRLIVTLPARPEED